MKCIKIISAVVVFCLVIGIILLPGISKTPDPVIYVQNSPLSELVGETPMEKLKNAGVIEGFEDGELHPEYSLTRAQFAKIITRVFELSPTKSPKMDFSDVNKSHWAYSYIKKINGSNLITGFPDGTFRPDDKITYEQAVTIVCKALNIDVWEDYPEGYLCAAVDYSLADGINAVIGEVISREQMAKLIINALEYVNGQIEEDDDYQLFPNAVLSGKSSYKGPTSVAYEAAVENGSAYIIDDVEIPVYNTEEYTAEAENVFKSPLTSPLSTFSIDTDTASYSNLRRFILNGQDIPGGAIRSEELINYFDYKKAPCEGENPFGVKYTVAACPWNSENLLAMITVSGEELKEPTPSNIVFLIDTSGSMYDYNKLPLVKQSLRLLLDKLGEEDTVSIVTYASETRVALEATPAREKEKIISVLDSLSAGGSTYGESGINLAYEQAEKAMVNGNNRVILCTDGDFNVGISSEAELETLISQKRESGIFLSVLGFGMGNYKDNKMETLADCGNGNYAYIDTLKEAKKVLVDDMTKTIYTIAKDVKIQVEFNPEKVGAYRLIGYENRILNNEDFENDQKDAGELGAGATVTVLYEIIPSNGEAQSELKYQSSETSGSGELMTVSIRHKLPEADNSVLTEYPVSAELSAAPDEDFYFACAVAELGMIVNNSEYIGTSTYDSVVELARMGIGDDPYGIRCEFVQLADILRWNNM